jgi:hypothetical protein
MLLRAGARWQAPQSRVRACGRRCMHRLVVSSLGWRPSSASRVPFIARGLLRLRRPGSSSSVAWRACSRAWEFAVIISSKFTTSSYWAVKVCPPAGQKEAFPKSPMSKTGAVFWIEEVRTCSFRRLGVGPRLRSKTGATISLTPGAGCRPGLRALASSVDLRCHSNVGLSSSTSPAVACVIRCTRALVPAGPEHRFRCTRAGSERSDDLGQGFWS